MTESNSVDKTIEALRERLVWREHIHTELLAMRNWMRQRGLDHDLAFLDNTESYVVWLDHELADVRAQLDALESRTPVVPNPREVPEIVAARRHVQDTLLATTAIVYPKADMDRLGRELERVWDEYDRALLRLYQRIAADQPRS